MYLMTDRLAVHAVYQKIAIPQDNRHIRIYDLNGERFMRLPRNSRQVRVIVCLLRISHQVRVLAPAL